MTRFILLGGIQENADKTKLGHEVFKGFRRHVNFLVCLFARNKNNEDWTRLFEENKNFFRAIMPDSALQISFILASEANFAEQVKNANIIYFSGGDAIPLYSAMARVGQAWKDLIVGKTLVGTSASTDMLSKYNYDVQQDGLDDGLGLANVKTIVHYRAGEDYAAAHPDADNTYYVPKIGWDEALKRLQSYKENLPVYALKEGQFVVVEQ